MAIKLEIAEETKEKKQKFDKYEVQNALRTIMEAEDILENEALMKEVKKSVDGVNKKITSIKDLRDASGKVGKFAESAAGEDPNEKEATPDDKAEGEDKESRVKNSKNPTLTGKVMK